MKESGLYFLKVEMADLVGIFLFVFKGRLILDCFELMVKVRNTIVATGITYLCDGHVIFNQLATGFPNAYFH